MIAAPPLDAGAVHVTVACVFPAVAITFVGAPGTVAGVTVTPADAGLVLPFVAVTVTVYVVPFVSPLTVHVSAPAVVHVAPPGAAVTV